MMMMRRGLAFFALVIGCGPSVELPEDSSGTSGGAPSSGSSGGGVTSSVATGLPGSDVGTGPVSSTGVDDTSTSGVEPGTTTSSSGVDFIWLPDHGGPHGCFFFEQNCARGEKCMPYSFDGGAGWNALGCFPVQPDPDAVGEPCTVVDTPFSGIDSCGAGAMCWDVDPDTLEGVCISFCEGSEQSPTCSDPAYTCTFGNLFGVCDAFCDPLVQDCPQDEACQFVTDDFICIPENAGAVGVGGACQFLGDCQAGSVCMPPASTPGCAGADGCCSAFCATDAAEPGCLPGQVCVPWYEQGPAPPGYETVGVCSS